MLGVAYEVGAILSEDMKYPEANYTESNEKAADYLNSRMMQSMKILCTLQKL